MSRDKKDEGTYYFVSVNTPTETCDRNATTISRFTVGACVCEQGQEGRGYLLLRQQERDGRHQGQHTGLQ